MNTEAVKDWLMNRLESGKEEEMPANMKTYLADNPAVADNLSEEIAMWEGLGKMNTPNPSAKVQMAFDQMLEKEMRKQERNPMNWLNEWKNRLSTFMIQPQQIAFACLIAAIGFFVGQNSTQKEQVRMDTLVEEVQQMREMMMLTLIEQPSVGKRLQAVSMTQELDEVDERVIQALFETLNNDPNINVRLVTVDALLKFADKSQVREQMIEAISQQQAPMVQLALAEAMILLKEKRSVPELRALIESDTLEVDVKERLSNIVQVLM